MSSDFKKYVLATLCGVLGCPAVVRSEVWCFTFQAAPCEDFCQEPCGGAGAGGGTTESPLRGDNAEGVPWLGLVGLAVGLGKDSGGLADFRDTGGYGWNSGGQGGNGIGGGTGGSFPSEKPTPTPTNPGGGTGNDNQVVPEPSTLLIVAGLLLLLGLKRCSHGLVLFSFSRANRA